MKNNPYFEQDDYRPDAARMPYYIPDCLLCSSARYSEQRHTDVSFGCTLEKEKTVNRGSAARLDVEGEEEAASELDREEQQEESQEDDPYEYDEDIRPSTSSCVDPNSTADCDYESREAGSILLRFETHYSQTGAVSNDVPTTRVSAPCWDCKSCVEGTPLFLLGSPTDTPCTCISCQY
ncbi:hypothetical protein KPH14_008255 [Odynerus spinipes]|uniref:Uncharacterized protein n=1 Tax=Odynerus spinipes TaxID=1348599 RepID=A0AAD9RGE8_9HYME|nr:hypothetical protein KPH14_008255 [Odynerus spinipes]